MTTVYFCYRKGGSVHVGSGRRVGTRTPGHSCSETNPDATSVVWTK